MNAADPDRLRDALAWATALRRAAEVFAWIAVEGRARLFADGPADFDTRAYALLEAAELLDIRMHGLPPLFWVMVR